MNDICFHSSDNNLDHVLNFNVDFNIQKKLSDFFKTEIENETGKNNLLFVDKYFDLINTHTENIIVDKNYQLVDESSINVAVLFKHIFRNFKEKQKYVKYKIIFTEETITFVSCENSDLYLKIPSKAEILPVKCITLKMNNYGDDNEKTDCVIEFTTNECADVNYPNFDMAIVFIKKLTNDIIGIIMDL
jgi:hypothetical protein